jgi:hypothetical protein
MSQKTVFSIGKQVAGRDIYNIARDLNISENSSAEDILKIVGGIQQKINELEISEKNKKKAVHQLEAARIELEDDKPQKKSIVESIKKTNEILKQAKATGESLKDIGVLVGKAAAWLGTTAVNLGWFF